MTDSFKSRAMMLLLAFASLTAVALAEEPEVKPKWPYAKDMKAFVQEIDRTYPFFDIKGIRDDWNKTKQQVLEDVKKCNTDQRFAELLIQLVRTLRDAHLGPTSMKIDMTGFPPMHCPGISFMPATKDRVIIMAASPDLDPDLKLGTIVTQIDGRDARKFLEEKAAAAWEKGGFFSSPQRARLFEYRIPLQGEKGETHTITILADKEKEVKLVSEVEARGWPHTYNMPKDLVRVGRSCFYGKLPTGQGYIYLRRVDPSVEEGIAKAVRANSDAKGWIIDLRGNGGGGYGPTLHEKLKSIPKPVACLIDEGCISAGETLARDIVNICDAKLFGSTTAGSSSSKRTWNFPSGIGAMRIPTRSRSGVGGKLIEYHGIKPHVQVEAVPEEVQQGQDSCILRAVEHLAKENKA